MSPAPSLSSGEARVDGPWPLIVVGAGAAGLAAAIFAARSGARTLLLETRKQPGAKIRVSGGGRCNILPSVAALENFHSSGSMKALRNVLFSWPLAAVRRFVEEELQLPLALEEATGKLFPRSQDARDVVAALLGECARRGVTLRSGFRVAGVEPLAGGGFEIQGDGGERLSARRLVLATGGLSLPKTGSDGGGLAIAARLGHAIAPTYPALVPLLTGDASLKELSGIALPVRLRARRDGKVIEERERELLFTHQGFSGPVVLDLSRHVTDPDGRGATLHARWGGSAAPDWDAALRAGGKRNTLTLLRERLPRRLAERLLAFAGVPAELRLAELPREARRRLVAALEDFPLPVSGNAGYGVAEVTGGGIALAEVHLETLESRRVPGLHFAGEMLDAIGHIGGYNFLWAWVTGKKAGEGAARGLGAEP
jgi:hypothetical protein